LRFLKALVVGLGVLLITGFAALVAVIATRAAALSGAEAPVRLSLPPEARIGHIAFTRGRLALHIEGAAGEAILVVDAASGEVLRRIVIAREEEKGAANAIR
jgi:hypothetical protein